MPKGLRVSVMINVHQGEIDCQHTVHFPKQEKSGVRLPKLQLRRKPSPVQSSEAEETTRNG
jgi:hypothetical protein